jgi:hypothetical protein
MEFIPFLHAGQIFNIACEDDLAFSEVRAILDELLQDDAFDSAVQQGQGHYRIEVDESLFEVWVTQMDVFVRRT